MWDCFVKDVGLLINENRQNLTEVAPNILSDGAVIIFDWLKPNESGPVPIWSKLLDKIAIRLKEIWGR